MGHIFYEPTSRRDFLKISVASVATLVTLGGCGGAKSSKSKRIQPSPTKWAFLADTHIPVNIDESYNNFYPYKNLKAAVEELVAADVEGISIAGDLARLEGKVGDYKVLKELLTPLAGEKPVFMGLGNHDDRDNFRSIFKEHPGKLQPASGKHVTVIEAGAVRIIMLDSLMFTNRTPGLLGHTQRKWLGEYLAQNRQTPTILAFHHTMEDHDGDLLDVPRLFKMIKPIRCVKAIVYGHSHVYSFTKFEDIHLINVPATGYNFSKEVPVGWVEASLTAKGGQFTLHAIAGDITKDNEVTEISWRA